jgi:NADPH-dependent ferric siderophore reductase
MAPVPVEPRPLNSSERAVLEYVLAADFDGAPALRSQLERTEVVAVWAPGSVSVDLRVREPVRRAAMASELVPVDAHVLDRSGEYVGELLVWTDEGATLAALEYAWVTDDMPTVLPTVDEVRISTR